MRVVSLTGTQLSTSRLGFGCSGLHQLQRSRARQDLLAAAFEAGVRHFDTAPLYGHGIAERELGKFALGRRSEVLIATKFGIRPNSLLARVPALMYAQLAANALQRKITKANRLILKPVRDYSALEAQLSLERSLRALRTDHVDIYFLHDPRSSLLDENELLLRTLERFRQEGKVRYVGLAGDAGHCIDVAKRFPTLAQIMQINAAHGAADLNLMKQAELPSHLSFGHFRDKKAPIMSLLRQALTHNESGVVLYSSRRCARVREVAGYLREVEPQ